MRRFLLPLLAALALCQVGSAQVSGGGGVHPSGAVTPGDCVKWVNPGLIADATAPCGTGGGGGTVTSVAATVPSWLSISGSPITVSGTLAFSAAGGQTANEVLASPNGSSGALGVRALVSADLPSGTANTGSVQSWTASQTFGQVQGATNVQSGTTYTTAATDCGKTLIFTSNSLVTVTIANSIVPASGTACIITVVQGGTAKVSVNGSAVTAATLESASAFTGTSGTQWAAITLTLTTVSATTVAILTGNGS